MIKINKEIEDFERELRSIKNRQMNKLYKVKGKFWEEKRKYSDNFNLTFKQRIIKRDGGKCQICGVKNDLTVHHIFYNKRRTDDSSCVTLCRGCNGRVNKRTERHYWTEYFRNILHYRLNRGVKLGN